MNQLTIIGNLTKDPDSRITQQGINVCSFTVAVNRRRHEGQQPDADFFRVTAWRQLADICGKYLAKGRKVAVIGPVSVHTYTGSDGTTRASLEVTADDVEFLSSRNDAEAAGGYTAPAAEAPSVPAETPAAGFTAVETDELPF